MSTFSQKIIEEIKKDQVEPISSWKFFCIRGVIWSLVVLGVSGAAFISAFSIHTLQEVDWEVYQILGFTWYQIAITLTPIFWLFLMGGVLLVTTFFFRKTRYGYRHSLLTIGGLFIIVSVVAGLSFEQLPGEEKMEAFLMKKIPQREYQVFQASSWPSVERQWSQPEQGLLWGTITSENNEADIEIVDFGNKAWKVESKEAHVEDGVELRKDEQVKIIGEQKDDSSFKAKEIRSGEEEGNDEEVRSDEDDNHEEESEDDSHDID